MTYFLGVSDAARACFDPHDEWDREPTPIGEGAYGKVYRMTHSKTGQLRALKCIPKQGNKRYHDELDSLANLREKYPKPEFFGIFHGWWEDSVNLNLSLEFFPHLDLRQHLKLCIPEEESALITWQILSGLDQLHRHGIAHRDLKPANIFVLSKEPWEVKIGDFGVSKIGYLETFVGTPLYMAPEVTPNRTNYGVGVDIWSLGIIVYEMLTLSNEPFHKKSPNMRGQSITDPAIYTELSHVTHDCRLFIQRLLKDDAGERPLARQALEDRFLEQRFKAPGKPSPAHRTQSSSGGNSEAAIETIRPRPHLSHLQPPGVYSPPPSHAGSAEDNDTIFAAPQVSQPSPTRRTLGFRNAISQLIRFPRLPNDALAEHNRSSIAEGRRMSQINDAPAARAHRARPSASFQISTPVWLVSEFVEGSDTLLARSILVHRSKYSVVRDREFTPRISLQNDNPTFTSVEGRGTIDEEEERRAEAGPERSKRIDSLRYTRKTHDQVREIWQNLVSAPSPDYSKVEAEQLIQDFANSILEPGVFS